MVFVPRPEKGWREALAQSQFLAPGTGCDARAFLLDMHLRGGGSPMQSDTHFFLIWTHGSADGLFGAASKPVIRNGSLLCFPNEVRARAECDRLSALGVGAAHYSVRPTRVQALKQIAERFSVLPRPTTSACVTSLRTGGRRNEWRGVQPPF